MIALSVSRTSLGLVPLTVSDVTGAGATLRDWNPGVADREVVIARSKWAPGGVATRTRDDVVLMKLELYLRGGSLAASRVLAETWSAALGQLDYTITETVTGGTPRPYAAMPASVLLDDDPDYLRNGIVIVSASIPRNPL